MQSKPLILLCSFSLTVATACRTTNDSSTKVYGAIETPVQTAPGTVKIRLTPPNAPSSYGHGFFVHPRIIITAAHVACFSPFSQVDQFHDGVWTPVNSIYLTVDDNGPIEVTPDKYKLKSTKRWHKFNKSMSSETIDAVTGINMDAAMIVLDDPIGEGHVTKLSPTPAKVGDKITMISYNGTGDGGNSQTAVKYLGTNTIANDSIGGQRALFFDAAFWKWQPFSAPGDGAMVQPGDSGSALYNEDVSAVVGIVDLGTQLSVLNPNIRPYNFGAASDIHGPEIGGWLQTELAPFGVEFTPQSGKAVAPVSNDKGNAPVSGDRDTAKSPAAAGKDAGKR